MLYGGLEDMNEVQINKLLKFYKERYYDIQEQESYKWEALQHFQKVWDIDAADFSAMLENALSKNYNLGSSQRYNAHKGIIMGARKEPESIRQLFRDLYDESCDVEERISYFKESVAEILQSCGEYKELNKQDVRAIVLYLTLRYPNHYYLYKYDMFTNFADFVDSGPVLGNDIQRALTYFKVCDELRKMIIQDDEIIKLYQDRRNKYGDTEYHMLVQDIIYSVCYYQQPQKLKHTVEMSVAKNNYEFVKPDDAKTGEFGSWKIINDNTIVKETNESFFNTNQTDIPRDVCWFFEAKDLTHYEKFSIKIYYDRKKYDAYIEKGEGSLETLMVWNIDLSEEFRKYLKETSFYPYCMFTRSGEKQYEVSIMTGTKKRLEKALDETYSDEEREEHARKIDSESLNWIVKNRTNTIPKKKSVTVQQVARDPYIAEYAKRRANGMCQLCMKPAPFNKANGNPYLESHHIIWLSEGGEDSIENTVALCPNCHRKMHIVNLPEDVQRLKERNKVI